jgi:peptidoglycan/xylan/chitin deacetylase (PgdA/CDA1 family)
MATRVALTVDAEHPDRPTRVGAIDRILACLAARSVPATFFIQGRWAQAEPDLVRVIAAGGHLIGHHSHSHVSMPLLSATGVAAEIRQGQEAIIDACGVDPRPWFRCPFGHGQRDERLRRRLSVAGYRPPVGWDVDTSDWDAPDATTIQARVAGGLRRLRSSVATRTERSRTAGPDTVVVLLHSWPTATAAALPGIIDRVEEAAMELVRLDAPGVWPDPDAR